MARATSKSLRRNISLSSSYLRKPKDQYAISPPLLLISTWLQLTYFSQHVNDAIDVDNKADYMEMVKKIHARNPGTTKIYVDMKHIEKIPSMDDFDGGSNESSEDDDGWVCNYCHLFLIAHV